MKDNLYDKVTQTMLNHLEDIKEGKTDPCWIKDWAPGKSIWPVNALTGNQYHGVNALNLFLGRDHSAYSSPKWCTFNQKQQLGERFQTEIRIKKGEHGTPIVRLVQWTPKDKAGDENAPVRNILKQFVVFNLDQMENVPEDLLVQQKRVPNESIHALTQRHSVNVIHSDYDDPCYMPGPDAIKMPFSKKFDSEQSYLSTVLHELVHWTGHKDRLDRLQVRSDKEAYAFEELIAELGSAFLCVHYGYPATIRHAQYLDGWMKRLKDDNKAFMKAATQAQKAVDYLLKQDDNQKEAA